MTLTIVLIIKTFDLYWEAIFFLGLHIVDKEQAGNLASSYKGTNPIGESSTLMTSLPLKGPTS